MGSPSVDIGHAIILTLFGQTFDTCGFKAYEPLNKGAHSSDPFKTAKGRY